MVEDVLTVVRQTEYEAEEAIKKAKAKAAAIRDKAHADSRRIALEIEEDGKKRFEEMLKRAKSQGEKEGQGIIKAERKKAEKLEKDAQKNLGKAVKLIVDSVLKIGGE